MESVIKIGVDNSEVNQKFRETTDRVESLGDVTKKVSREIKDALAGLKDVRNIDEAFGRIDELSTKNREAISELTEKVKQLRDASQDAFQKGDDKAYASYKQQADELERLLNTRIRLQGEINNTADALHREEAATKQATEKTVSFRTEMMHAMNDFRQMTMAMKRGEAVDPAKYEAVKNKLVEMRRAMMGVSSQMSILASATPTLTGLITAARGVTGAFSVAQGMIGLFNTKSEEMQKIMMRVQSLMAIMMGLQQVQTTLLKKDAILTVTLGKAQTWWAGVLKKATVAQAAQTAGTKAATVATTGLAGAFRVLRTAIMSVPVIGWIIAGVTALVAVVASLSSKSKEASKAFNKMLEDIGDKAAEPISKINELQDAWKRIQLSPLKGEFLKDAIKQFQELGYAIDDVKQAEELLSDPKQVESLRKAEMAKAQAEAARALIIEQEKRLLNAKLALEITSKATANTKWYQWLTPWGKGEQALRAGQKALKDYGEANEIIASLQKFVEQGDTQYLEILNTLGLRQYTKEDKSNKGKQTKQKTPEEIAKEYNDYLDRAAAKIEQRRQKRYSDWRKEEAESMAESLEKELKKIEDESLEAGLAVEDWRQQQEKAGFDALRKKYKDLYNEDYMGEMFDRSNEKWAALVDDWSENVGKAINAEAEELNKQIDRQEENRRKKAFEQEAANMLKGLTMREEYEKQKLEITKKYEKLIADELAKGNKEEAERLKNQGKDEIDDLTIKYNKENAELFRDVSNRSKTSLIEQLGKLRARLKVLQDTNGTLEEMKDIQEKLDAVQDALDEKEQSRAKSINEIVMTYAKALGMRQEAKRLEEQAAEARKRGDTKLAEQLASRAERLKETATSLTEGLGSKWEMAVTTLVEGFQLAAKYAQRIAEITGDTQLTDWADQASAFAQNLNAAWQGYQSSGSWIGAVAGGLSDMLTQTLNAKIEAKMWVKEFERAIKNFRSSIELAAVTFDSDKFQDMFGVRTLESATDAYRKMNDALRLYNERVTAAFTLGERQKTNKSTGLGVFLNHDLLGLPTIGFSAFSKKTTQKWYSELDAYQRGLNQLQAMQVQVKRANGWQKFWGKQSQYKSLYDVAPELWDENGEFNVENAEKFLQVSKQLTDEQRDQIQNAIDLKKAYDDAKQALEDIVSETVGSFADNMADAVWDAITTGANAWDIFKDKGNEAIESLVKQMMKEFAITNYLEQFKERLKTAYGNGDPQQIADVYGQIFEGIPSFLEILTQAGVDSIEKFKAAGIDVTATRGATSGSTGGYTTQMSHEDASEINGRLTDIQMQMRLVSGNVSQIVALQQESRGFARMQSDYLYDIRRYTATLPTIAEYSKKIATNTANL